MWFDEIEGGTRVRVEQRLVSGGEVAFLFRPKTARAVAAWCLRRDAVPHQPRETARLSIALYYEQPGTAARWLARVFGLTSWSDLPEEGEDAHLAHASANGAAILSEIHQNGYRIYEAEDLEGHRWAFAQARPTMA